MEKTQSVASIILQQLGGSRFVAMTGAKNLGSNGNSLSFKLPMKTRDGSNYVNITLTAMDDYQMQTMSIRGVKLTPKSFREGIYAENLRDVFTSVTGLETSLGTMGR